MCPHCGRDLRAPAEAAGAADAGRSDVAGATNLPADPVGIPHHRFCIRRLSRAAGRRTRRNSWTRHEAADRTARDADDITLAPGAIQRWEWVATANQPTCRLTGYVKVVDGGDRDVEVFVLTSANYDSLSKGGNAFAFLQTGKTGAVILDVTSSEAGRMIFAISNRFSPQAAKVVQLRNVQVVCQ